MSDIHIKSLAEQERKKAKELLSIALGVSGFGRANAIVDSIINAAVLELLVTQSEAIKEFKDNDENNT